jgi:hypothetical protein
MAWPEDEVPWSCSWIKAKLRAADRVWRTSDR